jgi:hypothetical protein
MPWQLNGTFLRINPDYDGDVWTKDQQAGIKVIAARHDVHDADLAAGIAKCVNIDGYNAMLANLDMGGFRITNLLAGIGALDGVNKTQLDTVEAKADQNALDIAAINTSDPDSIITAATFDALDLSLERTVGDFVVPLRRFNDFKAGQIIRHLGVDLTAALVTDVDTQVANRWYMLNNLTGTMDINFIRPTGADADLGENYFTEGLIIIENGGTPALPTLQGDGVDINPSNIIGSPTLNAGTSYTLSYMIQRTLGDVYRESYIWSAP